MRLFGCLFTQIILITLSASQLLASQMQLLDSGSNIFVQKGCIQCHPKEGLKFSTSLMDFAASLWNHGPTMVVQLRNKNLAVPKFSTEDMGRLMSFLIAYQWYLKEIEHPGSPERGEVVLKALKCSGCHAIEEERQRSYRNLLTHKGDTPAQLVQAMWNHGSEMVQAMNQHGIKKPRLSGQEMQDILAYLRFDSKQQEKKVSMEIGNPGRGAEIFKSKKCNNCHELISSYTPSFSGSQEFLQGPSHLAAMMWNHSVGMWSEIKTQNGEIPKFEKDEMSDLISYLYFSRFTDPSGNAKSGETSFNTHCKSCHSSSVSLPGKAKKRNDLQAVIGLMTAMWNHIPAMTEANSSQQWRRIQPGEMGNIVAYLMGINDTPDTRP